MEAREKCYTMKLTNVGMAEVKVSGAVPSGRAVIEFGDRLEARVISSDRIRRIVFAELLNPEVISLPENCDCVAK
jgi:hypothetical protein